MVRNGPNKRQRGDISAQFGVGACILLPPLMMAAVLVFFDSFSPQGDGPRNAPASESIVAKTVSSAGLSNAGASFVLASAEQRLLSSQLATSEQPSVAERSATDQVTERRTATEERPVGGLRVVKPAIRCRQVARGLPV